jgi:hypothetical protein
MKINKLRKVSTVSVTRVGAEMYTLWRLARHLLARSQSLIFCIK